jgi:hypothetical protein
VTPHREIIAADFYLNGVAKGGKTNELNGRPCQKSHFEESRAMFHWDIDFRDYSP